MKDSPELRWALLLGIVGLGALVWAIEAGHHALEGTEATTFSLPIVAGEGLAEAAEFDLAAHRGRVVVVDFWASWCSPCRRSIPTLNEVQSRYVDAPVTFVGVNVEGNLTAERVARGHTSFEAAFPSVQDRTGQVQLAYQLEGLPTLVVIDQQGIIRHVHVGVPRAGALDDTLAALLE